MTDKTDEINAKLKQQMDEITQSVIADILGECIEQAEDQESDGDGSPPHLLEAYMDTVAAAALLRRHIEAALVASGMRIADKLPPFCDECGAAAEGICGETHHASGGLGRVVIELRNRLKLERVTLGARIDELQMMAAQRDATEGQLRHDLHVAQRRSYGFNTEGMTQVQIATAAERITEQHAEIEGWKTLNRTLLDQLLELAVIAAPPPSPEQLARIEEIRANLRAAEERSKSRAAAATCEKSKEV